MRKRKEWATLTVTREQALNIVVWAVQENVEFNSKAALDGLVHITMPSAEASRTDMVKNNSYEVRANRIHKYVVTEAMKLGFSSNKLDGDDIYGNVIAAVGHIVQRLKDAEGPFEKVTALCAELARDLKWTQQMWLSDRNSLLANGRWWKQSYERLMETFIQGKEKSDAKKSPYELGELKVPDNMQRPSYRDLRQETREAALKEFARLIDNGTIKVDNSPK